VVIPSTVVEGDEWHAGFDESSGEQRALAEAIPSVGIASRIGLGLDIECFLGFWSCDQFDSLLEELIDGHDRVGCCRIAEAGESIDKVAEVSSGPEAIVGNAAREFDISDAEVLVVGVTADDKRGVFCA
jgi:hypothetical protein